MIEKVDNYIKNFSLSNNMQGVLDFIPKNNTVVDYLEVADKKIPRYTNEFWTAKQKQGSSLHEIAYRACFKSELPRFFIELLSNQGDIVYDPFLGRGTTVVEAGLLARNTIGNDINPLSRILSSPRLFVPSLKEVEERLKIIPINYDIKPDTDLSMFYHTKTEKEIYSLKEYLLNKKLDKVDEWIRMVATNRLTGHSKGFFSVYTLPPNQAVSSKRQIIINKKRNQKPEYRDIKKLILKKTHDLLRNVNEFQINNLKKININSVFLNEDARETNAIKDTSVQLTVTSPPFLDTVQYSQDNWLRCWFNGIDSEKVSKKITMSRNLNDWVAIMKNVFIELFRITKKGGWVAFEVGEIRGGEIRLDEHILPIGLEVGFNCLGVLINSQNFTKTSNIWGIKNNNFGTNTNRVVLFYK
jgi:hypothetical protein